MLSTEPASLYFLPYGAAATQLLAGDLPRGDFSVNELGFYWADYDRHAIRAVARDEVASGAFDLIGTGGDGPGAMVADDQAIVYQTNHGDLADLQVHVVPRVQ